MVTIDRPLLPPRLYRYRNVNSMELAKRELSAISNNYLWCSSYRKLNDPMEGFFGVSPWLKRQEDYSSLTKAILNHKLSIGICCFSNTCDNELMWTHYAGNYSGMCVAYSTNDLCKGLDDTVHIVRVAYEDRLPRIGSAYRHHPLEAARTVLSHKKSCWLYEREWRLFTSPEATKTPGRLNIAGKPSIKAVYLGNRMRANIKTKLLDELSRLKIEVRIMKVSDYEHLWVTARPARRESA